MCSRSLITQAPGLSFANLTTLSKTCCNTPNTPGTHLLRRKAERVGVVQPEEEKAPARPYTAFQNIKETKEKTREFLSRPIMTGEGKMVLN